MMKITLPEDVDKKYEDRKKQEQNFTAAREKIEARQNEVYLLRLQGYGNQEIADKLQVSLSTIEKDIHEIKTNCLKSYKSLQIAGVFQAFRDTYVQIDMVQKELWRKYRTEKDPLIQLKIIGAIRDTAAKKLEIFDNKPFISPFIEKEFEKMTLDTVSLS